MRATRSGNKCFWELGLERGMQRVIESDLLADDRVGRNAKYHDTNYHWTVWAARSAVNTPSSGLATVFTTDGPLLGRADGCLNI